MSEALDWNHGVFQGAALKSEATAAAEHKGKVKFRTYLCKPLICSKHDKGRNTNAMGHVAPVCDKIQKLWYQGFHNYETESKSCDHCPFNCHALQ